MLCFVYRLRHNGVRQGVESVLAGPPRQGWLAYGRPHPNGMPGKHAHLFEPHDRRFELLPELRHARVGRIEGGLLLSGLEEGTGKHARRVVIQTWAAAPTVAEATDLVRSIRTKQDVITAIWAECQA